MLKLHNYFGPNRGPQVDFSWGQVLVLNILRAGPAIVVPECACASTTASYKPLGLQFERMAEAFRIRDGNGMRIIRYVFCSPMCQLASLVRADVISRSPVRSRRVAPDSICNEIPHGSKAGITLIELGGRRAGFAVGPEGIGGDDGARTRDLRRDRPAF